MSWMDLLLSIESQCLELAEIFIFEFFDDLFCNGDFEEADRCLLEVLDRDLSSDLLLVFLGGTFVAKDKLPSRARLVEKTQAQMRAEGDSAEVDKIFSCLS